VFGAIFSNQLASNLAGKLPPGTPALSLLAGREHRWELYQRLAARAGVDLPPPQLWLLARLGVRPPTTEPRLLQQLPVDPGPVAGRLEQLRVRSLVRIQDDLIVLTESGRDDYERLVAARCAGLREHLAGWDPDQHPDLRRLIDELGRDLVSQMPSPTPIGELDSRTVG